MPSSYQLCLWKQESFLVLKAFFRSLLGLIALMLLAAKLLLSSYVTS